MRVVVVLGAGATLAQAVDARERGHAGRLPPLDRTFFEVLADLPGKVPPALRDYARELLNHDPFAPATVAPGMEEFFKDAFYDFVQEGDHTGPYAKVFGQLVVAYRGAIRSTTNWVSEHCDHGPVPSLLATAAAAADQVDVITFNHDLVVENALAELAAARGRWCLRHGYGHFASKRHFTLSKSVVGFDDPQDCKHPRPIRVSKLHGSLNLVRRVG